MNRSISGIHHVTGIAGAPQANLDFYSGFLGLRFVKKTVNFDDPGTYHFYFGDPAGRPGTILTFFPWPDGMQGKAGAGQASEVAFAIPNGSLEYWLNRFASEAMDFGTPSERFGNRLVSFKDPDGLTLDLVEQAQAAGPQGEPDGWKGPVPREHAILGFEGVTLWVTDIDVSAHLLREVFGYIATGEEAGTHRFAVPGSGPGRIVDLQQSPSIIRGRMGTGTIHHVAFRAQTMEEQQVWREQVISYGLDVTPVRDRQYFHSIYFREPGGVLFEIATDSPGFLRDEPYEELGSHLMLPPWLEPRRTRIEQRLPGIHPPYATSKATRT